MSSIERVARVTNLCRAAATLADRARELAAPLAEVTRLSPEGVVFALERSLEHEADERAVDALVESALRLGPPGRSAAVVLSANVFTAPLRALALAAARAERVTVKPSRRDSLFAELLVAEAADPGIVIDPALDVAAFVGGEIHAYGRQVTLDAIRATARVPLWAHGPGFGIAVVGDANPEESACALATDVALFDQRGCMSPRVVWSIGSAASARRFADALAGALETLAAEVPRGSLEDAEVAAIERWFLTGAMTGDACRGSAHGVLVLDAGARWELPPEGRHVTVVAAPSVGAVEAAVEAFAGAITNVGIEASETSALREILPQARMSSLGSMQSIPLDGPVDLRARTFG